MSAQALLELRRVSVVAPKLVGGNGRWQLKRSLSCDELSGLAAQLVSSLLRARLSSQLRGIVLYAQCFLELPRATQAELELRRVSALVPKLVGVS